ncbi:unnamed protein product [Heligmosomoides polygyrus]|uniref:Uncharacterized protein n=1 Tax=Heligmosomoides polygyrus TaxID=6339 RepID=A0A3P8E4S0_HELPZ|nr:unnamed protein product [Heligmosomoides polygyrus]
MRVPIGIKSETAPAFKIHPLRIYPKSKAYILLGYPNIFPQYPAKEEQKGLVKDAVSLQKQRNRAVSRAIPLADAEIVIKQSIEAIAIDTGDITNKLANVANDEAALDEKIERRKKEFEQMQKRFVKLQSFRPQYMDEYEKLESKLKQLYEVYVIKFRNLAYLQQLQLEIERNDRQKQEESERTMRQVVEKMRMDLTTTKKVYGNMTGAGMSDDDDDEDDDENEAAGAPTDSEEERAKTVHCGRFCDVHRLGTIEKFKLFQPLGDDQEKLDLSSGDDF